MKSHVRLLNGLSLVRKQQFALLRLLLFRHSKTILTVQPEKNTVYLTLERNNGQLSASLL